MCHENFNLNQIFFPLFSSFSYIFIVFVVIMHLPALFGDLCFDASFNVFEFCKGQKHTQTYSVHFIHCHCSVVSDLTDCLH